MKCVLTSIKRTDKLDGLRTKTVTGITDTIPILDMPFRMLAKPIDKNADVRYIETTLVKNLVKDGNVFRFITESGTNYKLKIVEVYES